MINELISKNIITSTNKNYLEIFKGIEISMYGSKAWAFTIQQLGLKKNKDYIYELGYIMGEDSAKQIQEIFKKIKYFLPKKIQSITNLIEIMGFGVVEIKKYTPNQEIIIEIKENQSIIYGEELYKENSLVPEFYAGVYSGFVNIFLEFKKCRLKTIIKNKIITLEYKK